MAIYLLIKQHNITGLKYLCKRVASSFSQCEKYKGSGTYWKKHLALHGNNVSTTCVFVTEDKQEFKKIATKYSIEFDIVKSEQWANLTIEEGQGGNTVLDKKEHSIKTKIGQSRPEVREKMLKHLTQHVKIVQPLAAEAAKRKLSGVPKTEEQKKSMMGKRPHVNQTGNKNNNAKIIQTPFGIFGSIREASKQIEGYSYSMIWNKLQNDSEWRYLKSQ